jgi:hypothetical protein
MKYTIEVNGKGAEAFIHKLTEEQYETLQDGGVEEDQMDHDQISEILGVEFLDTEDIITGIYPGGGDNIQITVKDESGEVVWESEDDFEFEEYVDEYQFNDTHYLSVEDYQKGNFFNYTLETDEDFNPEMLVAVSVELLDGCSELITDIKYKDHEMVKDYGDTRSKGFNYMLN